MENKSLQIMYETFLLDYGILATHWIHHSTVGVRMDGHKVIILIAVLDQDLCCFPCQHYHQLNSASFSDSHVLRQINFNPNLKCYSLGTKLDCLYATAYQIKSWVLQPLIPLQLWWVGTGVFMDEELEIHGHDRSYD